MPNNETLAAAAFFIAALLAGLHQYFRRAPAAPAVPGTVLTAAIGMGWLEREQAERLLAGVERQAKAQESCAASLAVLADRSQDEMKDKIDELMDTMRDNERRLRGVEGMRSRRRRDT